MKQWIKEAAKAVAGTIVIAGSGVVAALGDNSITWTEGLGIAITALGSGWIVHYVTNPKSKYGQYAKSVVAGVTAGLSSLVVALGDDNFVSHQEMVTAIVAAVVALGIVRQVPNADPNHSG